MQRLHGRQAPFHHQLYLAGVVAVDEPSGVGAGGNLDAGRHRPVQAFLMDLRQGVGAGLDVRRADAGVKLVNLEGGGEKGVVVGHHPQQVGVVGQIAAVFHRTHAGLDAHPQAGAAQGVAHRPLFQRLRLGHQRPHFVRAKGGVHGAVSLAGTGAAGGGEFDDIGAHPYHFADDGPHFVGAVGDPHRAHGVVGVGRALAAAGHPVADAAGGRNDGHRRQQARPIDQPLGDGLLEPGVQPAGVADAGIARRQRICDGLRRFQMG